MKACSLALTPGPSINWLCLLPLVLAALELLWRAAVSTKLDLCSTYNLTRLWREVIGAAQVSDVSSIGYQGWCLGIQHQTQESTDGAEEGQRGTILASTFHHQGSPEVSWLHKLLALVYMQLQPNHSSTHLTSSVQAQVSVLEHPTNHIIATSEEGLYKWSYPRAFCSQPTLHRWSWSIHFRCWRIISVARGTTKTSLFFFWDVVPSGLEWALFFTCFNN